MSTKRVKLGENANSFYDPVSEIKILPNQVVELSKEQLASKRINKAIKNGHLDYTDEDVTETSKKEGTENKNSNSFDASKIELTEKGLKNLNKEQLIEVSLHNELSYEDDKDPEKLIAYTKEELEALNKKDLTALLLDEE